MHIGKKTIDMDMIVKILQNNDPVSLGGFDDDDNKPLLLMMFVTPEYEQEARDFALSIINKHKRKGKEGRHSDVKTAID